MAFSQEGYVRALTFAARAHGDQKTPHGLPYVVHVTSVAMEVIAVLPEHAGRDADLAIACALLHDVLEDTKTPREQLEREFGARVGAGVEALTKDASVPKGERMKDSLARILDQPPEVGMVKLADRITNLAPPPSHWSRDKIAAYRDEALLILDTLGHLSPTLSARMRERLGAYAAFL